METSKHEAAIQQLVGRIDDLYAQAYEIVDRHWAWVRQQEASQAGWENKSRLQLRCDRTGNSIRIDWCGITWHGSTQLGTRRSERKHITKPRDSYSYSHQMLKNLAKDWEAERVVGVEQQLAEIRREAAHLAKAITYIRHARTAAKREGEGNT